MCLQTQIAITRGHTDYDMTFDLNIWPWPPIQTSYGHDPYTWRSRSKIPRFTRENRNERQTDGQTDDSREYNFSSQDFYRRLLEVRWQDHLTNNEVRSRVQRERTVMDIIRKRKLQLFGRICRMPDDRLLKTLMLGMVKGERQPGRLARRCIDDILIWCGQDIKGAVMMTDNRDNWRRFVASPYGPRWPLEQRRRRICLI